MDVDVAAPGAEAAGSVQDAGADDAAGSSAIALADPRQESQQAYSRRMGQWRRDARAAMDSKIFHALIQVFLIGHSPMDRHQFYVEKVQSTQERHNDGCKAAQLATGKAFEIQCGFSDKLVQTDWGSILVDVPESWHEELYCLIVQMIMHCSTSYNRRSAGEQRVGEKTLSSSAPPSNRNDGGSGGHDCVCIIGAVASFCRFPEGRPSSLSPRAQT